METLMEPVRLEEIAEEYRRRSSAVAARIVMCADTGCIANGASRVFDMFKTVLGAKGLDV